MELQEIDADGLLGKTDPRPFGHEHRPEQRSKRPRGLAQARPLTLLKDIGAKARRYISPRMHARVDR